jgi:5-methylcytosine-specific restriction endonuclease McrA
MEGQLKQSSRHLGLELSIEMSTCAKNVELEVHHIVPFSNDPALELDEDNCITLCKECHKKTRRVKDSV